MQNTEFILKAYLYNEYELEHDKTIECGKLKQSEVLLSQYQANKIFDEFKAYKNENRSFESGIKILIADDVPFMRNILKDLLQSEKECIITEASNGFEAIQFVEKFNPDIVILDINMPEKNGVEALKEIRKKYPLIKIIMCSAMSYESKVKATAELGANEFIVKPFQKELLIKAVFGK